MPHRVEWLIPDRVILFQFHGHVSLDDIAAASTRGQELTVQDGDPPVHLLADARRVSGIPLNPIDISRVMRDHPRPAMLGWVVVLAPNNAMMRVSATVLSQLTFVRINFRLFRDLGSAILFLQDQDERLRQIPTPELPDG